MAGSCCWNRGGERFPRLKLIWADSAYKKGSFVAWVKATFGWDVEVVEHPWSGQRGVWTPKDVVIDWEKVRPSGFHVLKWRWIVERTFAWLGRYRRLGLDRERTTCSCEAMIRLAMIQVMLNRLSPAEQTQPFQYRAAA